MTTLRYFSMLAALSLAGAAYAQTQATPDQSNSQSSSSSTYSGTGSTATQTEGSMGSQGSRGSQGSQGTTSSQGSTGSQTNPGANPAAASSPHQREATRQSPPEAATQGDVSSANPSAASSPHQRNATRMAAAGSGGEISNGMPVQTRSGESLGTVVSVVPGSSGHTHSGYVVIGDSSGGNATPVPYGAAASHVQNGKLVLDRSRLEKAPKVQQSQVQDSSNTSWQSKVDSYWGKGRHHGMGSERMHPGSDSGMSERDSDSGSSSNQNRSTNPDNPDQTPPRP